MELNTDIKLTSASVPAHDGWITIHTDAYYELVEKARKWDNLMKLLEVKNDE
jgi:hypothetical protein